MKAREKCEHTRKSVVKGVNPAQARVDWNNPALHLESITTPQVKNRIPPCRWSDCPNTGVYRWLSTQASVTQTG